jgi:maltooligosyltrehalose trehalohydrolase
MIFSVWAPRAKTVELVTGERRVALESAAGGYWRVELDAEAVAGGYKYSLDGGNPLPDPRSRWQPDGVHGASRVIEAGALPTPRAFQQKPLSQAVIYEMHIGTFTPAGTYAAAEERLPHLERLGITHLEVMPLANFPGHHGWGYDGVDLYAPLPAYGSPRDLLRFVEACHRHGIAVLLDVVYNHLGPDGNYLGSFGPYFTDRVHTAWGEAINYDGASSDEVRRFFIDNALMWLGVYGFDGLRLDAVHAIFCFEATHVLEELALAVKKLGTEQGKSYVLIAESDLNDPRLVLPTSRGGYALDAQWCDDFHHAIHRYFTREMAGYYGDFHGLPDIATAIRAGYVYQGQYSAFRERRHGRPPRGVGADQLVVFSQNHDQIGNRANGERLSALVGFDQLKAIAALTLLSPFVPLLFQGEEWAASTPFLYFTDHQDPQLGTLVQEGRAREFASFEWAGEVPNPQARETFERSKLDWSELERAPHREILDWYRRLIELRAARAEQKGASKANVTLDESREWLRFEHAGLLCLFNLSSARQPIPLTAGRWELLLESHAMQTGTRSQEDVPAHGTKVFRVLP